MKDLREFLTRDEFAGELGIHPRTVARWVIDRRLKAIKLGPYKNSPLRIPRSEVRRALREGLTKVPEEKK